VNEPRVRLYEVAVRILTVAWCETVRKEKQMRDVEQFLKRFGVAALALSILLPVLSLTDLVKLARKTWGWWH
jgi:hypothetical protein